MIRYAILLLLLPLFGLTQKGKDTIPVYLDANLEPTGVKNAVFYGVAVNQQNAWLVYAIYPDTTPVLRAYYKDRRLTQKEGPYTVYYPKYRKAREGHYVANQMTGAWQFWYENGQLKDSGSIRGNYLTGLWKTWHENGELMTTSYYKEVLTPEEKQMAALNHMYAQPPFVGIRSGAYASWYKSGQKESEGFFKDHVMDGDWHWYHPNGNRSTIETYKDGVVTSLQCFDTSGRATDDLCTISSPAVLKQYGDYKQFIFENLTWSDEAKKKKLQGDVLVRFRVDRDGKLQNLTFKSTHPLLQKIVEDFFQQHLQDWYPAISHNRVVVWEDELLIPFRLNGGGNYFTRPVNSDW